MSSSPAFRRRLVPYFIATALIVTQLGCASTTPRKSWWQFWRPKSVKTATDSMQPLGYTVPDESRSGLDYDEAGRLPLPPPEGLQPMTAEEYAALVDQPLGEPMREGATPAPALRTIHFGFDRFDLDETAQAILESNLAWMRQNPGTQIQIEGHCDERGTVEYNLLLGERRAKAVKAYLVARGIPDSTLHTISYGEERPMDTARSEEAYSMNRRAQFLAY